jgi:hypothetical protein
MNNTQSELRNEFLSSSNINSLSRYLNIKVSDLLPILNDYARDSVLSLAQGCLPVINNMFISTISN